MTPIPSPSSTSNSWQDIHAALTRIAKTKAEVDAEEAQWIMRGLRERVHVHFGYASFLEYLERLFGYTPKVAAERIRVAQALEELPATRDALRAGNLSWSAVREVTRVAVPARENEWLQACQGKSVRQVEELVSGLAPDDGPKDPRRAELVRHVLRFEVPGETLALFREARAVLEREVGHALPDEEVIAALAQRVLGGPADAGRATYQIAMTVCERCGDGWQRGAGEAIPVVPEVVEMAKCDAQEIGNPHVGAPRASQSIPPAVRRQVAARDKGRCIVPGCRSRGPVHQHHLQPRHEGGGHDPDNLGSLCRTHHKATHDGRLVIEGRVSTGLTFLHADRTAYGGAVSPKEAEQATLLFGALKNMGFGDREARRGVDAARPHMGEGLAKAVLTALDVLTVREEIASYGMG